MLLDCCDSRRQSKQFQCGSSPTDVVTAIVAAALAAVLAALQALAEEQLAFVVCTSGRCSCSSCRRCDAAPLPAPYRSRGYLHVHVYVRSSKIRPCTFLLCTLSDVQIKEQSQMVNVHLYPLGQMVNVYLYTC
jgi:hypothetical protein